MQEGISERKEKHLIKGGISLNTKSVAELLGISTSTVLRWVKQLNIEMERNEHGHFIFSEEKINILKDVKQQLQNGIPIQDISMEKTKRTGMAKMSLLNKYESIRRESHSIGNQFNQKADSVVSYQLLQHRREIDDLQEQVSYLVND